jgi:ubiquinone/menaquinone biosynthesis C-methylase UbiE
VGEARRTGDVRDISRLAYGFIGSKALFSALHLDLFTWLAEGPATVGDLSARLGVAEHRLSTLLSALAGLDLVDKQGDRWANGPASARYLVRGAPADFGDYYRLQIDGQLYPALAHLTAGLLGREQELAPGLSASGMADPAEADRFSRAQHAGSLGPAVLLSQRVDLTGRAHLLDVAGGTGAFAITLCLRHPLLRATIVDFPNVVTVGRRFVEQAGLADRIDFVAGDARNCPWPQADVVLMSYLLSAVPGADIPFLLAHARDVLDPNGLLLVHDFMLNDDRCGPDLAALWFLQYLAESIDTLSFTGADLTRQLSFLGFCDVEVGTLVSDITKLAVARAPTGDAGGELDGQPLVREGS